jgi:hypothetical protein
MTALALVAVLAVVAYGFSLWRHPYRPCWRCHGSKGHEDTTAWTGTFGRCRICGGSGRRIRWGVVLFRRGTYRAIKAGKKGRNY